MVRREMRGTPVLQTDDLASACRYCGVMLGDRHLLSCQTQVPRLDPDKHYVVCPDCTGGRIYD